MGSLCIKSIHYDAKKHAGDLFQKDYDKILDPIFRFEVSFPFACTHITYIRRKYHSLGKDELVPSDLAFLLKTPAWSGHFENGHRTHKMLISLPKCGENVESHELCLNSLICLSILWCQGHAVEKAKSLFLLINPPDTYKV